MEVLFRIGPLNIYKLGFFTAIGLLAGLYIAMKEASRKGIKEDEILTFAQVIVIAGFLGARLLFVLLNLPYYIKNPSMIWRVSEGGLSFHGAVLGGLLAGIIYARYKKVSFFKLSDVVSPGLALGYSIGRIGCDIYGKATKVPWAVTVDGIPRHPVQFYSALSGLIIFCILWMRRKTIQYDGELFLNFVLLYSVYRFFVEFFRESMMIGPLSIAQWVSLFLIFGSFWYSHVINVKKLTKNVF
jgi:phosphatidylglycerol:prolipoprotein diacylglycerol transferase